MKAYGEPWNDNCQYRSFRKRQKKKRVYSRRSCCYTIPHCEPNPAVPLKSECDEYPYGRDSPGIGWYPGQGLRPVGFSRETAI